MTELGLLTRISSGMSLPGQLYELQQIEGALERKRSVMEQITQQLTENRVLLEAQARAVALREQLAEAKRSQKAVEWELEDLQEKIDSLNKKLYGATVKNPKELLNLQREVESLKRELRKREDALLDIMARAEDVEREGRASSDELERLEQEWHQKQDALNKEKAEIEPQLASLNERRQQLRSQIDHDVLQLYEEAKLTKGQAIVRVEQGRCQGCHVTLPVAQWRRARSGELVQCGNCGRILYLE